MEEHGFLAIPKSCSKFDHKQWFIRSISVLRLPCDQQGADCWRLCSCWNILHAAHGTTQLHWYCLQNDPGIDLRDLLELLIKLKNLIKRMIIRTSSFRQSAIFLTDNFNNILKIYLYRKAL